MDNEEFLKRTRQFAINVFKLVDNFPKSKAGDVVAYQLLKSSSSVAANYRAVLKAKSNLDFCNKLKIVVEEADESNFWLSFIIDIDLLKQKGKQNLEALIKESDEFVAMFTKSIITINSKQNKS
jgi:four helix bundle protein